ncbi:DUF488 domain-containing protein [Luteipulveratus halotolerans]|uniref:MarR family transcriptional regulator n=1 Tax=Luteipulveratus halotolerans TaxID=1631356 RepID=A0A0L6CJS4_9MICO|nr:DUF488 family protein [Luteipulveratus halotolerans]KNX38037.1 hypothetical protein VV01_14205 [Luteipulveratus halotolerans]
MTGSIRTARVYDDRTADDGRRLLVDRLWPRGIRKDDPRIDEWVKEVAPSNDLRRWYGHEPERFKEFRRRYEHELAAPERAAALDDLRRQADEGPVTLVTATNELDRSHLAVLADLLNGP